jgi:membrane fusion protein, copper/silver efflux system
MFADVQIAYSMGEGLLVPVSAVLRLGDRDIADRVEPGDHFVPLEVNLSPFQFGNRYQVLEGLKEGEQIVISANFLIDSESRIRMGGGGMAGMQHGGHGATKTPTQGDSVPGGQEKQTTDHSGHPEQEMPAVDHSKMKH